MSILGEYLMTLVGMGLLLACSAFYSGIESALFSLSRKQIKKLRDEGHHVEKLLTLLTENPSGLLVAILFGNLVVNILFFCVSAVLGIRLAEQHGDWVQAAMGGGVLVIVILAGEIIPKAIGISYPERVVRLNSMPLLFWFHFMGPIRRILQAVTERLEPADHHDHRLGADELRMLIDSTHHDPTFGKQEKAIVEDIVNLPEIRVREIMVPRVQQLFRRSDAPAAEAMQEAAERELELIPIYEEDEDNIVGVVEVRDLFANDLPERPLSDFARPVKFVPETRRADDMLHEFLDDGLRMVCVVNEYGGLAGTICLEDLLEEVVGEFDIMEASPVEQLGETTYRLRGNLGIREWRSLFVGLLPRKMVQSLALDTVSGLVVSLLKRLPVAGDVVQMGDLRFTVEQVRSNRVESVLLELDTTNGEEQS